MAATRQHWVRPATALAGPTAVAGLLIWAAGALPPGTTWVLDVGWIIWLGLVARMCWGLWGWAVSWFAVTDERLLLSYGRLTHKLAMMPLSKVTDMTYVRTSVGQTLGYGEFVLESAGQDQALHRVRLLPRSQRLYDLIYEQLARRDRARHGSRRDRDERAGTAAPRAAAATGAGAEGTEAVRVTRSSGTTRAGRTPEPVRTGAGDDATQVVDAGPARRAAVSERGDRERRVRSDRDAERGSRGGSRDEPQESRSGGLARRAWTAVSGGPAPPLPTGPSGSTAGSPSPQAVRPIRSRDWVGQARKTEPAATAQSRSGPVGAVRRWAARAWSLVRGDGGSRL